MANFRLGSDFGAQTTEHARCVAHLEFQKEKAIIYLMDMCVGMTTDQARQIIEGRKKLVTSGPSDFDYIDDDWTPPRPAITPEEVDDICSKIIDYHNFGEGVYTTWKDLAEKSRDMQNIHSEARELLRFAKFDPIFAVERAKFLKMRYISEMLTLSEFCRPLIPGVDVKLQHPKHETIERELRKTDSLYEEMKNDLMEKIATSDIMDEEMKRQLIRSTKGITDAMTKGTKIELDEDCVNDTGWLAPNGDFYGCEYGQHIPLGQKLAIKFYSDEKGDHEQRLEDNGWVKCGIKRWWFVGEKLTEEQIDTMLTALRPEDRRFLLHSKYLCNTQFI